MTEDKNPPTPWKCQRQSANGAAWVGSAVIDRDRREEKRLLGRFLGLGDELDVRKVKPKLLDS